MQLPYQKFIANREILISLLSHPGHKAFVQYLKELDEAFDLIILSSSKTLMHSERLIYEFFGKRVLIREFVRMFEQIKERGGHR